MMKIFPQLLALGLAMVAHAQTPTAWLKFDGNLTETSGAGLVTAVTATNGFTPTYVADRHGVSGKAIQMPGSASVKLSATGDTTLSLGLRTNPETNKPFTLMAWINVDSVTSQGYNTVFGNSGSGAGTLHAGLANNSDKTHFGFDGNDLNGGAASIVPGVWYHIAWVYDGTTQRIFVNGIPDANRSGVTNTLDSGSIYIGNWGGSGSNSGTSSSNDFRGKLDDVAIYNSALSGDQILAIHNGASPTALPAAGSYFAPPTTLGTKGSNGNWGVTEIAGYPGIPYSSLVDVDRVLSAHAATPGGSVATYQAPVLNFADDEEPGNTGYFDNEGDFGTNTPGADDAFLVFARCTVNIPTAGDYTFGFRGDDGARLRVVGRPFSSSTRLNTANPADPAHIGDSLYFPTNGATCSAIGVVNLPAGKTDLEYTWWENTGGASMEVFAAPGSRTSVDGSFQLIGNTAAGGLQIVADTSTLPAFTVNGADHVAVSGGSPATVQLAWSVEDPATTLSIDQGIGPVGQSGSMTLPSPAVTTTYTITATSGADVSTASVIVYVITKPFASIAADATKVASGSPVELSWTVIGETSLVLNPGNINVSGQTSITVNPRATTIYTISATNGLGTTEASISVEVGSAPVIANFSASDANPVYGKETTLSWVTNEAVETSIDQAVGTVPATGNALVTPLLTTTYTLTSSNDFGTSTAAVTITMPTPIGINAAGFTARQVFATTPFPFTGQSYLESADSLLAGQNLGSETTQSGYTTINFRDGVDGDFTSGNNNFPGGGGDNFAVRITGTLVVNVPGEYNFIVNSDDGCRLRIDGVDVIVDDANHTPSASSGRFTFTKPTAQLDLVYYDATGGASCEMAWVRPNMTWQQLGPATPAAPVVRDSLVINEFAASGSELADEDGVTQDWIEIWNSSPAPIDLTGHYLSNSAANPTLWAFPQLTLAPDEYLIVFASEKDRSDPLAPLHTNFKLPAGGGYLSLKKSDGSGGFTTLTEFAPFPSQISGQSYGSSGSQAVTGFIEVPTPGAPNAASYLGFIEPVSFSKPRGRQTTAFDLALTSATPGAEIRYTTDGSEPTTNHGQTYTAPLSVASTTNIRAAAFLAGWKPSITVTHSYLFLDDIVNQTTAYATSRGWPSTSVNGQVYRYGVNPANVTAAGGNLNDLKAALGAAPSVCMTLDPEDLLSASTGIYSNPSKRGRFWERDASLEIINPDGTSAVQSDCGVRIRGGASRSSSNPKHAFHLYFRSLYSGDLIYPLFGNQGSVGRFDQIDMRCEQNNSWSKDNSSNNALMREQFARRTQGDQGQPYSRGSYFHLYINGIYWGVFDWQEKTEADFGANQFGGEDSDYDTVKSAASTNSYNTEMTDGNFIAWQQLFDLSTALEADSSEAGRTAKYLQMRGLNPDGTRNPNYPVLLDVDNLADYMLTLFYTGGFDGPVSTFVKNASNNWFGIRRRDGDRGFMFFMHDNEHSMGTNSNSYNRVGPWGNPNATSNNWGQTWNSTQYRSRNSFIKFNPEYLHEKLAYSSEYRMRFMDRVQKNLFGNGPLTTAASIARADEIAAQVAPIIHAEAARWGSTSLNKSTWISNGKAGVYSFLNTSGPQPSGQTTWPTQTRDLTLISQLKGYTDDGAKPLASSISAPGITGQQGGGVPANHSFQISNPNGSGTLYYTLDGADPRAIGGTTSPAALTGTSPIYISLTGITRVQARVLDSNTWSPVTDLTFIVAAAPANATNTVISKLHYNPIPATGPTSVEFVEIMNIGSVTIDLSSCKFTLGITFNFPQNYQLPAGGRCLIVENVNDFTSAFPAVPPAIIAGAYSGSLKNSGEQLIFLDKDNLPIRDFTYDDESPWPTEPDGNGPALVLVRPITNPDHAIASNWRASTTNGGTPGIADSPDFATWRDSFGLSDPSGTTDSDHDGLADLMEFALGLDPNSPTPDGPVAGSETIDEQPYLTLTTTRPLGRDEVGYSVEFSSTMAADWVPAVLVSSTPDHITGTLIEVYRAPVTRQGADRQFLRAKAVLTP